MTIFVRCSDPRFNDFLEKPEIKERLFLSEGVAPIANTGGIKYFMHKNQLEDFFGQLDILVHHFKADRIVLLNHTDCGFYKKIDEDKEENYLQDLIKMRELILEKFSSVKVSGFLMNTETGELIEA